MTKTFFPKGRRFGMYVTMKGTFAGLSFGMLWGATAQSTPALPGSYFLRALGDYRFSGALPVAGTASSSRTEKDREKDRMEHP